MGTAGPKRPPVRVRIGCGRSCSVPPLVSKRQGKGELRTTEGRVQGDLKTTEKRAKDHRRATEGRPRSGREAAERRANGDRKMAERRARSGLKASERGPKDDRKATERRPVDRTYHPRNNWSECGMRDEFGSHFQPRNRTRRVAARAILTRDQLDSGSSQDGVKASAQTNPAWHTPCSMDSAAQGGFSPSG